MRINYKHRSIYKYDYKYLLKAHISSLHISDHCKKHATALQQRLGAAYAQQPTR